MGRKVSFIILCLLCYNILSVGNQSFAVEKNVKDCLETNEDCLEDVEQPVEEKESNENKLAGENIKPASFAFNFVKMIFALLLVLALIYFLLTFIKKRNKLFQQVNVMENLGGISVGQNKSIQLIRIGEKIYVIGVGDNVDMLQELTDEEVKFALLEKQEQRMNQQSIIKQFFKKQRSKRTDGEAHSIESQFTTTLKDELHKLKNNRISMIDKYKEKDDEHV